MHTPFSDKYGAEEHEKLFGVGNFLKITCIRNPVLTIDSHIYHKVGKLSNPECT